ncbi:phage tail tip lysozyme [Mesorhizobium sp. LNJC391B00]|uniref:phage tail tip lysozyme n=1 Tax=Mesorhizobium sp. LNJC391B00 TaxID=1287273 RepID=UPI0003CE7EF5|nr:phage tail tip lysozyme [Mesorhizobium sp. LNJC391B00]ESY26752.1 hypothetical protein X749_24255 [Mesorhizobium sp. LNJC391B00]
MAKGKAQDLFRSKAPWIMALLMRDFKIAVDDAAAIVGNLGHESGGFASLQETKPTVPSSRGGFGWAQWTGPRRRKYEAYYNRAALDGAGDQANYGFLFSELKGSYRGAIAKLQAAKGLAAKVKAFELAYEQSGKKHYASRNQWAAIALEAWNDAGAAPKLPAWALPPKKDAPPLKPAPTPPAAPPAPEVIEKKVVADPGELHTPVTRSKTFWTWMLTAIGAPVAAFGNLDWRVQLAIVGVIVAFAAYGITRRAQLAQAVRDLKAELE